MEASPLTAALSAVPPVAAAPAEVAMVQHKAEALHASASLTDVESGSQDADLERLSSLRSVTEMQLVFKDLRYTVEVQERASKKTVSRDILKGLSGIVQPGRLTAVMGASGAGKTTFLNVLAGIHNSKASVGGSISINGQVVTGDAIRRISGFVHQEDVILDTMTVREALLFAAELKLPRSMTHEEKERRAMDIADMLNLRKSLDSLVGSALIKGISGGEKRRLSLGMEMITNPSVLFLDEPTSGLDSYTAFKVVRILRSVAHRYRRTILCTIHQPSSEVFAAFDDVVVLAEGEVMYHGAVADMVAYFASIGYPCPANFNPADHLFMGVLNLGGGGGGLDGDASYDFIAGLADDEESKAKAKEQEAHRIQGLVSTWQASEPSRAMEQALSGSGGAEAAACLSSGGVDASAILHRASFWTQFGLLFRRAARNEWRNHLILKGKVAQTLFLSIIIGLIYLQLGDDEQSVQDRQGSLFFIVIQAMFGSVMGRLTTFGTEKGVFQREYTGRMYSLPAYFSSRVIVTLPTGIILPVVSSAITYFMIGYQPYASNFFWYALILVLMDNVGGALGMFVSCLFNDIAMAMTVMPMFLLPLMIFSGFFVNNASLGWWFRWISYISPMRYGFMALAINEFTGLEVSCDPTTTGCSASGYRPGEDTLELLGFNDQGSVGDNAGYLFALFWGYLMLAYVALWAAVRRQVH